MSICRFIASDCPLPEFAPAQDYPVKIDLDNHTIDDGGADDNYVLRAFNRAEDYTDKKYGVYLEWNDTDGRAEQILRYIKTALHKADPIEFWLVWLMDCWEYEERPYIHKKTISIHDLTTAQIRQISNAAIWNTPDPQYPQRPSFYCLTITR